MSSIVNRKERRRMEKLGYSKKQVMDMYSKDVYDKGFSDGIRHTADSIMIITAYVLHTHLGLGKKRLPEIMYWIHENIDSFNTGHLVPSDIDLMKEELVQFGCQF